jgi:hypothetical protein
MLRRYTMSLGALCLAFSWTALGSAETIILNTGLDEWNNLITTPGQSDAHWTVNIPGNPAAHVVMPGSPDWAGNNWLPDGPDCHWIARDANTCANGNNEYDRVFDLTGWDLSTVSMTGFWAADDDGTLALNGHVLEFKSLYADSLFLTPFEVRAPCPYFNQGLNTLSITVTNADNLYEGVRLIGAVSSIPEPSTLVLTGIGAFSILAYAWRRRRAR